MKVIRSAGAALLLVCGSIASAQQPTVVDSGIGGQPAATLQTPRAASEQFSQPNLSLTSVTPDIWLYTQEWRRHDDPAQAVRRKAEARAEQRMQRIAAMKWYGLSNSRPHASVTPSMGVASPSWTGNGLDRYDWVGGGYPAATIWVDNATIVR